MKKMHKVFFAVSFFLCFLLKIFSCRLAYAESEKLITAYDISQLDHQIIANGWSINFYENSQKMFIQKGKDICEVPDHAYLDTLGIPRDMYILPSATSNVTKTEKNGNKTHVWWSEPAAWHDDYGTPARNGSYLLDEEGRVTYAESDYHPKSSGSLSYSYDVISKPTEAVSCYKLRLP